MAEPIRVAHVMGKMVGGGVEQVVMNYYRHIDRERVQFDFLVDADSALVPREEIESLGGRVVVIPPYQHQVRYQHELVDLFKKEQWPIIHSHVNALSVFPLRAAKRAGVPVRIAHSHSTSGGHDPVRNAMKAALRPLSNVYPTHRAACTRHAGEWLFGRGGEFRVIPNAIDLSRFRFDPDRRAAIRASLGLSDYQLVVGHVGRFSSQKNQAFLIRAFARVVRAMPESLLLLVGEGRRRRECEALAASLCPADSVLFLGQRSDVADLYQALDVFCLPSEFEGLGMVAVEAEVSGLPCVLSDSVPEDADPVGTATFLPICDEDAWAAAITASGERTSWNRNVDIRQFDHYRIDCAAVTLTNWYLLLCNQVCQVPVQSDIPEKSNGK